MIKPTITISHRKSSANTGLGILILFLFHSVTNYWRQKDVLSRTEVTGQEEKWIFEENKFPNKQRSKFGLKLHKLRKHMGQKKKILNLATEFFLGNILVE